MKKIIFSIIILGSTLAILAACATPTQAPPTVEDVTTESPTEPPTEMVTDVEEAEPPATETPTQAPTVEETEATEAAEGMILEGEALIQERCSACHSVDRVYSADKTAEQWGSTIDRMVDYGADVSEEEKQMMIEWLVSNFGQ